MNLLQIMVDLRVENLRKEYGSIVAVDDISFEIEDEEFVTIVGPSGSGKTTAIRMIAGLETPTNGTIEFGGKDMTKTLPQERDIAMLFQDVALYPHMSVRENIGYGLKIAGISKEERNKKIEEVAEMLQITDQLEKKPGDLSGGQQQRVALGRSMARDPSVFLFDEPMSDLDAKLKRELRPIVEEVTRKIACPTVYVTHDQEEAMSMSDRIIVMDSGEIAQMGTPEEVYNDPQSRFVGQFIGQPEMQFFEGEIAESETGISVSVNNRPWDVPETDGLEDYIGQSVVVGIRPQDLRVTNGQSDPDNVGLVGSHRLDEPLGERTISYFETDLGRITAVTSADFRGNQESEYVITPDVAKVKIFDSTTDQRIV